MRALRPALLALLIVLLLALPVLSEALRQPAAIGLATQVLIYAVAAMSLNLILGYGGMISFGHAAFFGIGGYVTGILYSHFAEHSAFLGLVPGTNDMLIVLPLAMLISGLMAAIIGAFCLRTNGVQFIMITLAFAQMLFFLFVSLKTYGGDDGLMMRRRDVLPFLDTRNDTNFYLVCLTLAGLWLAVTRGVVRSKFGLVLGGLRQNEQRMEAIGIAPYPYKLVAFIIAGMGAGLAGALMANYLRFVSPDMMNWTRSGDLMMMVILGGVGTLMGPLLGAAAFVILESWLTTLTENWQFPLGLLLLALVLFTNGGLAGLLDRLWGRTR